MNELLQQSILDAFSEIQKWNQQFIIDDAGNSVDLASATLGQQSTTPLLARNHSTTFPHRMSPKLWLRSMAKFSIHHTIQRCVILLRLVIFLTKVTELAAQQQICYSFVKKRHLLCTTPIERIILSVMTYAGLRKVMYHLNSRPVMTFVGIDPIRVCCLQ